MASSPTALIGLVVVGALNAGGDAGDDRLLRALVQPLATPLDRAQELVEVDLEGGADRPGPILHLEPRLAGLAASVVDDLTGLALGELDDLGLRRLANGLLAGLAENPVALALGLGQHLLAVDADLVGQRNGLRVVHEVVQLVDQNQYIHRFAEFTEETGGLSLCAKT